MTAPTRGSTEHYVPPKQGRRGQLIDSVFILLLLFAILFGVTYYSNSAAAPATAAPRAIADLPITQTERDQYQKIIDEKLTDLQGVNDQVAASTPKSGSEQYPISLPKLLLTILVIGAYLAFVYVMSFKEYREVIREKFGPSPSPAQGSLRRGGGA